MSEKKLIYADDLYDKVSSMGLQNGSALGHHSSTADAIAEMIQNAPAVDPASCLNWRTGKPPEHESWFAKFKDTEQWRFGMFETMSDEVLVTVEFPGGERYTTTSHTTDGEWLDSYESIGATRLERACNEMHEFQQRYRTKILTENRKSATDAMREDLKGICDFEVRLPQTKAPRNRREEQLRMAQNEGAEIAWLVMAATTHLTFGFGKERLARLKQETLDNYRQYIGWVEQDGEAYAMELLRRCSEQALQEELKINDMRESKDHILPGGSAEAQRADMLRAMEAVSAKMAAERGITRQPLAVLSQSEISRRMSAI